MTLRCPVCGAAPVSEWAPLFPAIPHIQGRGTVAIFRHLKVMADGRRCNEWAYAEMGATIIAAAYTG